MWRWLWFVWLLVFYVVVGIMSLVFDFWLVNYYFDGDLDIFVIFWYGVRELLFVMVLVVVFGMAMLFVVFVNL